MAKEEKQQYEINQKTGEIMTKSNNIKKKKMKK